MDINQVVRLAQQILKHAEAHRQDTEKTMDISEVQETLIDLTWALELEVRGPIRRWRVDREHVHMTMMQALYRYRIPFALPVDASLTFEDLASTCGVAEPALTRILRYAMTSNIFREPKPGFVAHTASSLAFRNTPMLSDEIGVLAEDLWPATGRLLDAIQKWPQCEEPYQTGYNLAFDTPEPMYKHIGSDPARVMRFRGAMGYLQSEKGSNPKLIATSPVLAALSKEHDVLSFVEVGGNVGLVSRAIAQQYPQSRCTVQDSPEVIANIDVPSELSERLQFVAHNFFENQPETLKGDVFFLRQVLHNWSDKYAIQIIRALIPALRYNTAVLVNEHCLPKPSTVGRSKENYMRHYDLVMLSTFNGKERDLDEWVTLFKQADESFVLASMQDLPSSYFSLLEFRWMGGEASL